MMRRLSYEKIHRNIDFTICWIEYLADGQDSRFGKKEADDYLQG